MSFRHLSANSAEETLAAMKEHGEDGKVFAGGVALSILMKSRVYEPEVLIDIAGASDLDFIEGTDNGGVRIGAKTVHRKIELSPLVQERFPLLRGNLPQRGHDSHPKPGDGGRQLVLCGTGIGSAGRFSGP